jgi:hypothetical protein
VPEIGRIAGSSPGGDAGQSPGPTMGLQVRFRDNTYSLDSSSGVQQLNDSAMQRMAPVLGVRAAVLFALCYDFTWHRPGRRVFSFFARAGDRMLLYHFAGRERSVIFSLGWTQQVSCCVRRCTFALRLRLVTYTLTSHVGCQTTARHISALLRTYDIQSCHHVTIESV